MSMARRVIAGAILLLLAGGAYYAYQTLNPDQENVIRAAGTIEATLVKLNSRTAGTLKTVNVQEGDQMSPGDLAFEITRDDLAAARERDATTVTKAQAQLSDLLSGARQAEIKELEAMVATARASAEKADQDLLTREALYAQDGLSQEELEKFRLNAEVGKNQVAAAEARLALAMSGSRTGTINAARAEVERSRAVLKASEAAVADLKVTSPLKGIVVNRNYEPGEFVTMGATVVTVADLDDLWIKLYIPTDDLPSIALGQKVEFTVSGHDKTFQGTVAQIASQGEFTPRTIQTAKERTNVVFEVKVTVDDSQKILKPGMPCDAIFVKEDPND